MMTQMRCTHFEDVEDVKSEDQYPDRKNGTFPHQAMRVALGAGIMWDAWRTTYGARIRV